MAESQTPSPNTNPQKVEVYQEKSALFRVIQADGVWSSVNPWGNLHLAFYSERAPIPKKVYWGQDENGKWRELSEEREGKKGWFRELEVDVVLSPSGARGVLEALENYLKLMEPTSPNTAKENPKETK